MSVAKNSKKVFHHKSFSYFGKGISVVMGLMAVGIMRMVGEANAFLRGN
jgi:hypothetical protein